MIQLILFTIFIAFLFICFEEEIFNFCARVFRPLLPEGVIGASNSTMSIICTICQDFLTERPEGLTTETELEAVATRCGHLYHTFCIDNWFSSQGRQECPICKTNIDRSTLLSIYPSGDEQSGEMAAKIKKAGIDSEENAMLKGELNQFSMILEEMGQNMQDEKVAHDKLKYEFVQKLSEIDELQRQCDENNKMKESSERNWMEVIDKTTHERNEALKTVAQLEKNMVLQKTAMEKRQKEKVAELYLQNSTLQYSNDELRSQIEILKKEKDLKSPTNPFLQYTEAETQTDDKDLLQLRSRWLMYKTCMKHLENELLILENECCDIQNRQLPQGEESQEISLESGDSKSAVEVCSISSLSLKEEIENQMKTAPQEDIVVEDDCQSDEIQKSLPTENFVCEWPFDAIIPVTAEVVGIDV